MKGAIIYFSGTGNTEFVAKEFKKKFGEKNVECSLIDVSKKKKINDLYDFFIFGSPVHGEDFPDLFLNWIDKNLFEGKCRRCIVFSTQSTESGLDDDNLLKLLRKREFNIVIQDFIIMPNNYYVAGFNKATEEEKKMFKDEAKEKVEKIIEDFILDRVRKRKASKGGHSCGSTINKDLYSLNGKWAIESLHVDMDLCVRCGKCVKNCPTQNINLNDCITFKTNCMSCQKCLHSCPVNAFVCKGKKFEQYKI